MKLSRAERWILSNQLLILEKLESDPDQAARYAKERQALNDGFESEYSGVAQHVYDERYCLTEDECGEVLEILSMFKALHFSYDALADKSGIDVSGVRFKGFDGNNETKQLGYAQYLSDRFPESDTSLNSHMPMLPRYREMLAEWNAIHDIHERNHLSKDAIIRISSI